MPLRAANATVRSAQRRPLGGKGYYEIEILKGDRWYYDLQYGFASAAFARVLGASEKKVGDDGHSWAVDGVNQCTKHKGETGEYKCDQWKNGGRGGGGGASSASRATSTRCRCTSPSTGALSHPRRRL